MTIICCISEAIDLAFIALFHKSSPPGWLGARVTRIFALADLAMLAICSTSRYGLIGAAIPASCAPHKPKRNCGTLGRRKITD